MLSHQSADNAYYIAKLLSISAPQASVIRRVGCPFNLTSLLSSHFRRRCLSHSTRQIFSLALSSNRTSLTLTWEIITHLDWTRLEQALIIGGSSEGVRTIVRWTYITISVRFLCQHGSPQRIPYFFPLLSFFVSLISLSYADFTVNQPAAALESLVN